MIQCMRDLCTVKEDIFFTDVTTCFNALKKAVQDLSALTTNAIELQMGQPSMRYAESLRSPYSYSD